MLNLKLFTVLAFILASGIIFDNAFAAAGEEFSSPTQTNAYASYNNSTNQVQISWDFNTLPANTKCFLKGDINFHENMNVDGVNTSVASFIPIYYSAVTSTPVQITAVDQDQQAEEISCTGDMRIDIDTIMSHSTNTENYPDFEAFLTFYVPNSGENFETTDNLRIDEVSISYNSNAAFDQATKDYICGGQIGSTLYIDQSGSAGSTIAHGNNGDNCGEYVYLENDEYVDIGMVASPQLQNGEISFGNHVSEVYSLLIQVVAQIAALVTSSGGDDDHNSKPTFGLDHKTFVKRVDNGLVINGTAFPVTDNYWTEFPMLSLHVGETQNFTATVFSPNPLTLMEFAFGIKEVGEFTNAEASIVIETNYAGEVLSSEIVKDTTPPVLNATSLESSVSKVKCVADDNSTPCYRVSIEFSFMEPPLGKVFGVQAIDDKRKNTILYFNDGITLEGDSQNPPVTQEIISEIKYKGLQTIQRIDKENNIWMTLDDDEPVELYKQNDFGSFTALKIKTYDFRTPDTFTTNPHRLHSDFPNLIIFEQNRAMKIYNSTQHISEPTSSWSYDYTVTDRMEEIYDDIEKEKILALENYEKMFTEYERTVHNFEE